MLHPTPATLTASWQQIASAVRALAPATFQVSQEVWSRAEEPGFDDRLADSGLAELDAILVQIVGDVNVLAAPSPESPEWLVAMQTEARNSRRPDLRVLGEAI